MHSSAPDIDSQQGTVPRHIAIIMDGNNRWARNRGLPGNEGHRAGEQVVQTVIEHCAAKGVQVVTLYAFSSENWRRPADEVNHLMALFLKALDKRVQELHAKDVQIRFIGDRAAFSADIRDGMTRAEELTANNQRMTVAIAANYGAHWDITQAARQLAAQVQAAKLTLDEITPERLQQQVALGDLPLPDLIIRTGGEQRLSNFLLWQAAYSEFWFTPVLWPDFDRAVLDQALQDYASRQRRFGRSGDEVSALNNTSQSSSPNQGE